jgi:3-deoxy-D-manno-octulosonic-acid transferase
VVLTESELWPNFLRAARRRGVTVVVANARLSPRSFSRLRWAGAVARRLLLARVSRFAVQEETHAARFRLLGVPAEKLVVTGSVKYDGAATERHSPKTQALAKELAVGSDATVWLAGSTHAPEETVILGVFARLRIKFPGLRLILVPRHPDRFDEVARLVKQSGFSWVRRSRITSPPAEMPAIVLLDTVGELGTAWGLADIGFTGGSLDGYRGGQSMIEPAGYGVPCAFGPHVWNFRDVARQLIEVGGAVMVTDAVALEVELTKLLSSPDLRQRMGQAAQKLVRRQLGATARTLDAIDALLPPATRTRAA